MQHFYIRKAAILAVRTVGLGMLVPALLMLGGIIEGPVDLWWRYALACLGFVCASCLLIGLGEALDRELAADLKDWQQVPVRKIDRSRRYSA